jgi:hypothetical protein
MTDRKKPGVAFWVTVVVVVCLPLLYVLSFGPACWWFSPIDPLSGASTAPKLYLPIGWVWQKCPNGNPIDRSIRWYATLLRHDSICVPCGGRGACVCGGR